MYSFDFSPAIISDKPPGWYHNREFFKPKTVRLSDKPTSVHLTEQVVEKLVNGKRCKVKTLVKFPVFRGSSNNVFKQARSDLRYEQKLASRREGGEGDV